MFEKVMMENLRHLLRNIANLQVKKIRGRIWCQKKDNECFSFQDLEVIKEQMPKAFGLESCSPVIMCENSYEAIEATVVASEEAIFSAAFAVKKKVRYRVRARRGFKEYPMTSKEIELALAEYIGKKYDGRELSVDLSDSTDVTVGCEVRENFAFIFYEQYSCPGGLPVGSNAPVLALLSGGIDSPVACYMLMKRGCRVDFLSFHSRPYTPPATEEKVQKIAAHLNTFQRRGRLFSCNLSELQKAVRDNCNPAYRTILYRRLMMRIAGKIAFRNKLRALLTGEAVGQVASQTVDNMNTINDAAELVVLRPLVGMDKNEAVEIARRIGTFDLSNVQVPDSCTVFQPGQPVTKSRISDLEREEAKIADLDELLRRTVDAVELIKCP